MNYSHPNNWAPRGYSMDAPLVKNAAARESLLALCNAMAAWLRNQAPVPSLDLVRKALSFASTIVTPTASHALGVMLPHTADPPGVLLHVFQSAPARSRGLMLRFVPHACSDLATVFPMIQQGLLDRSASVREFAAETVRAWNLRQFLPELQRLAATDRSPELRETIKDMVIELEQGYTAEYDQLNNCWSATVPYYGGGFKSFNVEPDRVASIGLRAAVRERFAELSGPDSERPLPALTSTAPTPSSRS